MHKNAYFIRYVREKKKIKANCRHPQPLKNVFKKKAGRNKLQKKIHFIFFSKLNTKISNLKLC